MPQQRGHDRVSLRHEESEKRDERQSVRRKIVMGLSLVATATMLLAGCGTATTGSGGGGTQSGGNGNQAAAQDANPPFQNRLKDMPATPDANFDPKTGSASVYGQVTVYAADGTKLVLDARKTPLLFEAYWCPHCQRTLVMFKQNRDKLARFPVLVSMGFAPGTTLSEAVQITKQEMNYFHISNVKEYYYLGSQSQSLVPLGFPTMAFPGQGGILTMAGEHTLSAWEQALKSN